MGGWVGRWGRYLDEGEFVQHVLLGEVGRSKEEIEPVDADFRKGEKGGEDEDGGFFDFDGFELWERWVGGWVGEMLRR